jgi:TatD DNase family protein
MKYLDVHTHQISDNQGEVRVFNLLPPDFLEAQLAPSLDLFSAGLHPWYLQKDSYKNDVEILEKFVSKKQCVWLGECGLDRLRGPDLAFQQTVFVEQLALAARYQKPVLVHCVRAFSELLGIIHQHQPQVPVLVHGFRNKPAIGQSLLDAGLYLSFGEAILHADISYRKWLGEISISQFFLETDDASVSLPTLYQYMAQIRGISVETLQENMWKNFHFLVPKNVLDI